MKNGYKWIYSQNNISDELFAGIKKVAGSEIIAKLLINRGIVNPKEAENFLDFANAEISSPYLFPDMEKAVKRINKAIQEQEHIVVFGDFDADGVTSTSLLYKTLKLLEANASFYLPDRMDEGHGLNRANVCKLISSRKTKLFITVDCGISNVNEIKLANSFGADVIITDHHEPQEEIPPAYAIIDPKMLEETELNKNIQHLAGVGVAYKLAVALLESNNKEHLHDEIFYFVALGTVGDVVPLLGENRTFVHQGMNLISQKKPPAIGKILEIGGYKTKQKISAGTIAFGIVPKINAVGRLGDASPMVDFLLTEDEEKLNAYVEELNENNKKRQEMCEETFLQAEKKIKEEIDLEKSKSIILADKDWHPGIIGIVASKFVEKYYRPAFLVSISEEKMQARGSARSVDCLNLFETLSEFADLFIQFGGHALAAGFSFDLNKITFERFREKLDSYINENLNTELLKPELRIDVEIQPQDLTENFIKEIEKLEPFGEANPSPVFSMSNLTLMQKKKMGAKKNHLKLFLSDDQGLIFEAVWWKKENLHIEEGEKVNIAFAAALNTFMDKTSIQLIVKDLKPASDKEQVYEEETEEEFFELETEEISEIIADCEKSLESEQSSEETRFKNSSQTEKAEKETFDKTGHLKSACPPGRNEATVREEAKSTVAISTNSSAGAGHGNTCELNNNGIKWFDQRNATGLKKDFVKYMKSLKNNITIFAETSRSLNIFENNTVLKELISNRTNLKKSDHLVIMDLPPDEKTFFSILSKTHAKEIYLIGLKIEIDHVETIKKFSSMLKYAFNNKNGIINIEQMASILSISSESILACVELLDSAKVIEVLEINEDSIKFNFSGSKELNTMVEQPEYQTFVDSIKESTIFRQKLATLEIEKIREKINKACLELV